MTGIIEEEGENASSYKTEISVSPVSSKGKSNSLQHTSRSLLANVPSHSDPNTADQIELDNALGNSIGVIKPHVKSVVNVLLK